MESRTALLVMVFGLMVVGGYARSKGIRELEEMDPEDIVDEFLNNDMLDELPKEGQVKLLAIVEDYYRWKLDRTDGPKTLNQVVDEMNDILKYMVVAMSKQDAKGQNVAFEYVDFFTSLLSKDSIRDEAERITRPYWRLKNLQDSMKHYVVESPHLKESDPNQVVEEVCGDMIQELKNIIPVAAGGDFEV